MLKKLFITLLFLSLIQKNVYGVDITRTNNKFGIHLAQPHFDDLQKAKELVNSNGGDWGYITLVIQENDRNREKWQDIFNRLRELHLIPIIRLATIPQGASWRRPAKEDASTWVDFLNSLNWVIKNRYVILFNEPNHGAEWGGDVDVNSYVEIALEFAKKLKEKNPDFFVMLAGLDASAPHSPPQFEDEAIFLRGIFNNEAIEQWNNVFSGLASHSYPNPGFAGSPLGVGRGTVRTYQWELELLKSLGIKNLPVFITETGWIHNQYQISNSKNQKLLTPEIAADNFRLAYENVWLPDNRVVAVTPFVLDYQGDPFLQFSWKKYQSNDFYPQYYTVQSLSKERGDPEQIEKGELRINLPKELVAHSNYLFKIQIQNQGQAIWDKENGYRLSVSANKDKEEKPLEYLFSDIRQVKPHDSVEVDLYLKTDGLSGKNNLRILLLKGEKQILESREWSFEVFPLPSLDIQVNLFPKVGSTNGNGFELQIFDTTDMLIFKKANVKVRKGKVTVEEIQNVALGQLYRLVLLKPYYLPRQTFVMLSREKNVATFEKMLPLDFNKNGKIDVGDAVGLIKNPKLFILFAP